MNEKHQNKILVVDDEAKLLKSYQIMLESAGFLVDIAQNGKQAVEYLNNYTYQVALVDLRIKDENGIALGKILQKKDNNLQIIIITGYPCHETAVQALKVGAFDYLSKTSETESIIETINEAIVEYQLKNHKKKNAVEIKVICDNTFTKNGLLSFAEKSKRLQITDYSSSIQAFIKDNKSKKDQIILICGSCNFDDFDRAVNIIKKLKFILSESFLVIFNHNLDDKQQIELIKCGVSGFLDNSLEEEKTETLLLKVLEGEVLAPRSIVSKALRLLFMNDSMKNSLSLNDLGNDKSTLTAREKEILKCVARGLKNREIAEYLFISEKTVKTHMNNIFKKLDVDNRLQAINAAYKYNLII